MSELIEILLTSIVIILLSWGLAKLGVGILRRSREKAEPYHEVVNENEIQIYKFNISRYSSKYVPYTYNWDKDLEYWVYEKEYSSRKAITILTVIIVILIFCNVPLLLLNPLLFNEFMGLIYPLVFVDLCMIEALDYELKDSKEYIYIHNITPETLRCSNKQH